jgi:hypothetical protein
MNKLQKSLAVVTLFASLLALLPITTAALTTIDGRGKGFHTHSISGFVVNADQDRRNITLRWDHKWTNKRGANRTQSYQASFKVAEGVVFKNGSWSNIVKGAKVRIIGDGNLVEQIEL